jgi:hypothetical protein
VEEISADQRYIPISKIIDDRVVGLNDSGFVAKAP